METAATGSPDDPLVKLTRLADLIWLAVKVLAGAAFVFCVVAFGLAWQVDRRNTLIDRVVRTQDRIDVSAQEARSAAIESRDLVQGALDNAQDDGEETARAIAEIHRLYCRAFPLDCSDPVPEMPTPSTVTPTT